MSHKVLMFGWEIPPHNSGGLGVACHGIIKAMSQQGDDITFVLPRPMESDQEITNLVFAKDNSHDISYTQSSEIKVIVHIFDSILSPYLTTQAYEYEFQKTSHLNENKSRIYAPNLVEEVQRYAQVVDKIPNINEFEVIHCHDWLTVPAGIRAKELTGKPLFIHIHATEMDRTGGWCNQEIFDIEKMGMEQADHIIAVSDFTKQSIINNYGIDSNKIEIIHNGIDYHQHTKDPVDSHLRSRLQNLKNAGYQIVLFTGRLTFQKGVDYLLEAAKKALMFNPKSLFIITGSGDMEQALIRQASELKISDRVIFTGFLRGKELKSLYDIADLFVMPSVSEPFGLVALESAIANTPVLISKQSGVSEVMSNSLKVDFWDVDDMADKMVAVLEYEGLKQTLTQLAHNEVKELSWHKAVDKMKNLYRQFIFKS